MHMWSIFLALYGFIDSSAEEVTGNRMREMGSETQQRAPGWESTPGPLQWGQASVHGTPALPTELNGAPHVNDFKWVWANMTEPEHPNRVVFVPKLDKTISTALSQHKTLNYA